MIESVPNAEELDTYLNQMVQTVKDAVDQGMRKAEDDPASVDKVLQDVEEILDHIMEGKVDEWTGE